MKPTRIASRLLVTVLVLALAGAAAARPAEPQTRPQTTFDRANTARAAIEAAQRSGELGHEEAILLKALSLRSPDLLPEAYRGEAPDKCGTVTAAEVKAALPDLPDEVAREILDRWVRPTCDAYYDTPHFRIHYDTSGPHTILGYPSMAFRDSIATAAERSWSQVVGMGFRQPPSDAGDPDGGGGNGLYDIYVQNLDPGYLGVCYGQYTVPSTPRIDCTSYTVIDNDYAGYGDPYDLMQVTVAHEFCHACQYSSNYTVATWYMESTSVWVEDVVFDDINDYRVYLSYYLDYPYASFEWSDPTGLRMYGSCVWNFFLSEFVAPLAVPEVWNALEGDNKVYPRTDAVLGLHGTSLEEAFKTYCVWNWFTGSRDDGTHYAEGLYWPVVAYERTYSTYPVIGGGPTQAHRPDHMAWNYIRLSNPGGAEDILDIGYDGPTQSVTMSYASINTLSEGGTKSEYGDIFLDQFGNGSQTVTGWDDLSEVSIVIVNASTMNDDMSYSIDVDRSSPVAGSLTAAVTPEGASVTLRWTLAVPGSVTELNIYRAGRLEGPYTLLNAQPIPPTSPGSYVDADVLPGDDLWYELRATLLDGTEDTVGGGPAHARIEGTLGLALMPARPNPFRESAAVGFTLPDGLRAASVTIYDVRGRLVKRMDASTLGRGRHTVTWDGTDEGGGRVAAGVYFCSLEVEGAVLSRKLTLLR
jgi:hypothetical protein